MQTITDSFLSRIRSLSKDVLTSSASMKSRECILDYLGVSLAGASVFFEKEDLILDSIKEVEGSRVIGHRQRTSTGIAALLNGISSHFIELDDGHRMGMLHLGSPIISALLSITEKENLSTDDLLRGIIIGYETAIRLACAIQPGCKLKGYHATGTCGTIGATTGIASALKFDFEQMKSAFSAACSSAAGLLEMMEGDSDLKPYNAGRAAMDGVAAAYIGRAGLKAPEDALGGRRGFLRVMTNEPNLEYLTDFAGDRLMIEGIYLKPYAACRHCHPSIEAALHIRAKEGFNVNDVESIHVDTYNLAVAGHDHTVIKGVNSAKMSIPYSFAVALCTGKADLDEFTESGINNPEVLSITSKVTVSSAEELTALCPQKRVAIVTVKTSAGQFSERIDYPKGEPENPLSRQELEEKFRGLALYSGLSSDECDEVIAEVWKENIDIKKILNIVCK